MAKKQQTVHQIKILGLKDIKALNVEISKLSGNYEELKDAANDAKKPLDDTGKGAGGAGNGISKFAKGAAAATAALVAFNKVSKLVTEQIKKGVDVFKGYEFEMQKVRAISGANEKEFKKLDRTAQALGRSTFFTAQQVAALQLNFSKLGFTSAEVLKVQEAALLGATATGEDLARTATVIGSTVRGFGLDASDGARVADVMAASFTSSALTLEKFQTSMTKVSPVAKLLGMDLEETTAVMGVLTDAGIEASIAGTSLRNIFLKLGDPSSDLAKSIGFTVNSGEDMVREFRRMRDEGINVEKMLEVVDVRQVAAISTMIEHIDKIESQTEAFRNSTGAAQDMADIIQASLQGATLKFNSALDGLRIVLVQKIAPALTSTLNTLSEFFNMLAKSSEVSIVEDLQNQQNALIDYELQLFDANISEEHRIKLVKQLKSLHPDVLANIDAETASNKLLRDSLVEINNQLQNKILLSVEDEKITEANMKTTEKFSTLRDKRQAVRDRIALLVTKQKEQAAELGIELSNEEAIKLDENLSLREQALEVEEQYSKFYRKNFSGNIQALSTFGSVINAMVISEGDYTEAQTESLLALEEKKKLMIELGIFADNEEKKKKKEKSTPTSTPTGDDVDPATQALADIDFWLRERKLFNIELFNNKEIASKEELNRKLLEIEMEQVDIMLMTKGLSYEQDLALRERFAAAEAKLIEMNTKKAVDSENEKREALEKNISSMKDTGRLLMEVGKAQGENSKATRAGIKISQAAAMAETGLALAKQFKGLSNDISLGFPQNIIAIASTLGLIASFKSQFSAFQSAGSSKGGETASGEPSKVGNQFANGGLTKGGMFQGNSHANGGVKFRVGGRIHEAEGGEAIINKKSTSMFRPMLSAINSYNGNGVKFADGGLLNSGEKFAMGGELRSAQQLVSGGIGSSKVVIVESDMTDVQNRISAIESQATF